MKTGIMVSVYCLAYNHERYIRKALEGFVNQKTDFSFEVFVHDDASTDKTTSIIEEYHKKYPEWNDYKKDFDLNENLNLLSKEELDKKKKKMDEYYEQNNIKVGDKNFQYDIRKDFNNDECPAEWDDEDDDIF